MVIALLALGLVMILGGIAAVVQGFPYVRLESGLAMVLGGTIAASSGVVTLGLAAVVLRLKRIEGAVLATRFPVPTSILAPATAGPAAPADEPALAAVDSGSAAFADLIVRNDAEPVGTAVAPRIEPEDRIGTHASSAEPWLPKPNVQPEPSSPSPEPVTPPVKSALRSADEAAPENGDAEPSAKESEMTLRPSLEAPSEPSFLEATADEQKPTAAAEIISEPKPDDAPAEEVSTELDNTKQQPESGLEVIGTYSSGGNTYVMFADGTIEADTPRGRFNFNSLDELKDFVGSGDEHHSRGAA